MLVLVLEEVEEDPVESVETSSGGPSPSDTIRSPWRKPSLKVVLPSCFWFGPIRVFDAR